MGDQTKTGDQCRKWYLVNLENRVLGRVATRIATVLRGKNKPNFSPHIDSGDFVVVLNAAKVRLTGNKLDDKNYYRHSGYFGGLRTFSAREFLRRHPKDVIRQAVSGMLPKNKLGRQMIRKLKVYVGGQHPHRAQKPMEMTIDD